MKEGCQGHKKRRSEKGGKLRKKDERKPRNKGKKESSHGRNEGSLEKNE